MNKQIKIVSFVLGLGIFTYLVHDFGFSKLLINLTNYGSTIFYAIIVWFIAYLFNAYCYYEIINEDKKRISFIKSFNISISSFALNYITPFISLGGEAYRAFALKEELGNKRAISSTLLYNILHVLSHFIFWLTGAICLLLIYPNNNTIIIFAIISIIVFTTLIIFIISKHKKGIFGSIINFLSKIQFINNYFKKHHSQIEKLIQLDIEISSLYINKKSAFYKGLIAELLSRVIASLEFYFILLILNIDISIIQAIYIHAISSLILNITFFIPMGLGIREAAMYFIFGSLCNDASIGVFVAIINRIREFFWIFIGLSIMQFLKFNKSNSSIEKWRTTK